MLPSERLRTRQIFTEDSKFQRGQLLRSLFYGGRRIYCSCQQISDAKGNMAIIHSANDNTVLRKLISTVMKSKRTCRKPNQDFFIIE